MPSGSRPTTSFLSTAVREASASWPCNSPPVGALPSLRPPPSETTSCSVNSARRPSFTGTGSRTDRVRAAAPRGVTAAIDTVGTDEALDVSIELVSNPARIASITGSDRRFGTGIRLLGYGPGQDAGTEYRLSARAHLVELAGAGDVRVIVAKTFALDDAAKAHEFGQSGGGTGKIILLP